MITDKMLLRQLEKRNWLEPITGLRRLGGRRLLAESLPEIGGSRSWRDNRFGKYHEETQAAIFTYGLSRGASKERMEYTYIDNHKETSFPDWDCVIRASIDGPGWVYRPVQLKEIVPGTIREEMDLQGELDKLKKYNGAEVVVAVFVNREMELDFKRWKLSHLPVEQLWFYGRSSPSSWFMIGGTPVGVAAKCSFHLPVLND